MLPVLQRTLRNKLAALSIANIWLGGMGNALTITVLHLALAVERMDYKNTWRIGIDSLTFVRGKDSLVFRGEC